MNMLTFHSNVDFIATYHSVLSAAVCIMNMSRGFVPLVLFPGTIVVWKHRFAGKAKADPSVLWNILISTSSIFMVILAMDMNF